MKHILDQRKTIKRTNISIGAGCVTYPDPNSESGSDLMPDFEPDRETCHKLGAEGGGSRSLKKKRSVHYVHNDLT